jgi:hypothetical protein
MPYCPRCGVEVDTGRESCPLCDTGIPAEVRETGTGESRYPQVDPPAAPSGRQVRILLWSVITSLMFTAFLVCLSVNLILDGSLTWGGYAMSGIGAGWIFLSLLIWFFRNPWVIISGFFLSSAGLLALLDFIDGEHHWFLTLGLPLAGMSTLLILLSVTTGFILQEKRGNMAGFIFIYITIFCIGVDLLVSGFLGAVSLSWSFIVMAALLPLAILLLAYHYLFRRFVNLESYFHL